TMYEEAGALERGDGVDDAVDGTEARRGSHDSSVAGRREMRAAADQHTPARARGIRDQLRAGETVSGGAAAVVCSWTKSVPEPVSRATCSAFSAWRNASFGSSGGVVKKATPIAVDKRASRSSAASAATPEITRRSVFSTVSFSTSWNETAN